MQHVASQSTYYYHETVSSICSTAVHSLQKMNAIRWMYMFTAAVETPSAVSRAALTTHSLPDTTVTFSSGVFVFESNDPEFLFVVMALTSCITRRNVKKDKMAQAPTLTDQLAKLILDRRKRVERYQVLPIR